jgi:hypothetical protein
MRKVTTMKQSLFGTLIISFLVFPADLRAQTLAQPLGLPPPSLASAAHAQLLPQIRLIQRKARSRMLTALAPAHLALLSRVIGELAVEQDPDIDDAAKRLNAALSPAESSAVLAAESSKMTAARNAVHDALTPKRAGFRPGPTHMRRTGEETNAGLALIRSVIVIPSSEKKQ